MAFGRSLALLGAFCGGILGPGPREEAPRGPEDAATHPRRGPKRLSSGRQVGPRTVPKGQKPTPKNSKTTSETKMTKSSKITTLSMKMLDFEGSKGVKIVQNGHPGGFKIKNFENIKCKAAAESILEALGWKRSRAVAVLTECAGPVSVSFRGFNKV